MYEREQKWEREEGCDRKAVCTRESAEIMVKKGKGAQQNEKKRDR